MLTCHMEVMLVAKHAYFICKYCILAPKACSVATLILEIYVDTDLKVAFGHFPTNFGHF